jgi:hypothetical protein
MLLGDQTLMQPNSYFLMLINMPRRAGQQKHWNKECWVLKETADKFYQKALKGEI